MLDSSCPLNSTPAESGALSPLCPAEGGEHVEDKGQHFWTQAQEQGCLPTEPY